MPFYHLLCLLLLLSACKKETQIKPPVTKQLPPEDASFMPSRDTVSTLGLSNITRNILQDKNGDMWFASWEGIVQYDGKNFINRTLKDGLRRYHVFSMLEDSKGNLWFGTVNGGVYKFDGKHFIHISTINGLAGNLIFCITEDSNGDIWFGTEKGISRYNGTDFTHFSTKNGLFDNTVYAIIQDQKGQIWVGTKDGLVYQNLADLQSSDAKFKPFVQKNGSSFTNIRSMIADKKNRIWIGGQDGLWRYDNLGIIDKNTLVNIDKKFTMNIYEDRQGKIWISQGTDNGSGMILSSYDGTLLTKIMENDHQIFGVTEDTSGNIWIGTAKGVTRFDGTSFEDFSGKAKDPIKENYPWIMGR